MKTGTGDVTIASAGGEGDGADTLTELGDGELGCGNDPFVTLASGGGGAGASGTAAVMFGPDVAFALAVPFTNGGGNSSTVAFSCEVPLSAVPLTASVPFNAGNGCGLSPGSSSTSGSTSSVPSPAAAGPVWPRGAGGAGGTCLEFIAPFSNTGGSTSTGCSNSTVIGGPSTCPEF